MSNFPNNAAYNPQGPNGQYAVMTPPPRQEKKGVPLAYTACGGLLVGVVAGLLMISAGPESPAIAATTPAAAAPLPTLGELVADEANPTGAEAAVEVVKEPEVAAVDTVPAVAAEPETVPAVEAPVSIEASLRFDVTPPELRADLKIEIDGQSITSDSYNLMLNPKTKSQRVQLTASADGYRDFRQSIRVEGDMNVAIEMRKVPVKATNPNANSGKQSKGRRGGKSKGPGGLLDL